MKNFIAILAVLLLIVCFVSQAQAQTSVLVQTDQPPAVAAPQAQVQVQVQPPQYVVPQMASQPVWLIRKKWFGFGYRARPGWVHGSLVAPPVATPTVVAPPPVVVQPPTVQLPQPIIRYTPQVEWRNP